MPRCCGRNRKKFVAFFTLLSILTWVIYFLHEVHISCDPPPEDEDTNITVQEKFSHHGVSQEDLNEVLRLYSHTPNLWGTRGSIGTNTTVSSRIKAQREWVKGLSSTQFVKLLPTKRILVFLDYRAFAFTNKRLKCPYAPEFESRCQLFLDSTGWEALLKNPKPDSFYMDLKLDAVVGFRDGYWGADFWHREPQVPSSIRQVYYLYESPCHTGSARLGETGAWLASYWRGADIPIPYREVVKQIRSAPVRHDTENYKEIHNATRNLAVALISNCRRIQNNRLGYIRELRKTIPVDVYGGEHCASKRCPPETHCLAYLGSQYKFYLAFENCNCEDYISEKHFVNALEYGMVPVVMGGRLEDYIEASPPNSFIHVDNFATPKALADHLLKVDKNWELYLSYHAWRYDPELEWTVTPGAFEDFFCRLCGMLYYYDFQRPPPYHSCYTRWGDLNKCLPRGKWNWGR